MYRIKLSQEAQEKAFKELHTNPALGELRRALRVASNLFLSGNQLDSELVGELSMCVSTRPLTLEQLRRELGSNNNLEDLLLESFLSATAASLDVIQTQERKKTEETSSLPVAKAVHTALREWGPYPDFFSGVLNRLADVFQGTGEKYTRSGETQDGLRMTHWAKSIRAYVVLVEGYCGVFDTSNVSCGRTTKAVEAMHEYILSRKGPYFQFPGAMNVH